MILDAIWAVLFAAVSMVGVWLLTRGRYRRLTLREFYDLHRDREFYEVAVGKVGRFGALEAPRRALVARVAKILERRSFAQALAWIELQLEIAGTNQSAAGWATLMILKAIGSLIVTIILIVVTSTPILILLPFAYTILSIRNLKSKADKRKAKLRRLLPPVLNLMAAASVSLTQLDGARGVMNWSVMTIENDATAVFKRLMIESSARHDSLEDTFDRYAARWDLKELATLAQIFRLFHKSGRGLRDGFANAAQTWQEEQERVLELGMGRKIVAATLPLVIFDIPALLLLLLAPAAFQLAADLHL